jgi:outer membrane lipase/esterase
VKPTHYLVAALSLAAATVPASGAMAYSALYSFGDSLSDAGNVYLYTGGAQPAAPYYAGEYSNGLNWIQDASIQLGLAPAVPSLLGGNDYAWGGATTGYGPTSVGSAVPSLTTQVGQFIAGLGTNPAPSTGLYTVWIGANDISAIITGGITGATAVADAQGAAATEAAAIQALANKGATTFIVPLVPDLGLTPRLIAGGPLAQQFGTFLSETYNTALESDLLGVENTPGIHLRIADTFSLLDEVVASPASFDFTDVSDPCYVGAYTGGGTVCGSPDQYVFWDQLHPTAAADVVITDAALPEPASLALFGLGLLALAWTRGRAQRAG